jgi:glycosyltransferase involved in cell wall biosynthesis
MDASRYGLGLKLTRGLCAWLSGKPDAVVANSFAGKHVHLQLGYQPRRFVVIPNGIDGGRFQPSSRIRQEVSNELGIAAGERVALTVARNDPMKGYGTLLAAARALPDIRFVLVGTGTQELRGLDNIIALGQRDDVERIATAADFIVSSSLFGEGFSNAIGEGMAAGLCPVVSDVGDARIIVGDSGYVVTPGSTAALVNALRTAAAGADLALLQQRARQRIVETYTVERMVQAFDALHVRAEYPAEAEQCAAS